jgi:hypothetical protein
VTTDPDRLLSKEDDAFAVSLLRAGRDEDAALARSRKAAVLGAGGAAVGSAALVAKLSSSKGLWALFGSKWLLGALAAMCGLGVGAAVLWPRAQPRAASETAQNEPRPASAKGASDLHGPADPATEAGPAAPVANNAAAPAADNGTAANDAAGSSANNAAGSPANDAAGSPANNGAGNAAGSPASNAVAAASNAATSGRAGAQDDASARSKPIAGRDARSGASSPAAAQAASSQPEAASSLSEEVASLRTAREALGRGDAKGCLAAVDAYFAAFPKGHLGAEARVLRVEAMFAAGQKAQAAALASAMLAQSPRSPYAARLRTIAGEDAAAK